MTRVDAVLPLSRLDDVQTYLVAWIGDEPVGHAHIAWEKTKLGIPEIQDVFVVEARRRRGIATALTAACEELARSRGHTLINLSRSLDDEATRSLYERAGYVDAGAEPVRVQGTIMLRGAPFAVDDTLVYLVKTL